MHPSHDPASCAASAELDRPGAPRRRASVTPVPIRLRPIASDGSAVIFIASGAGAATRRDTPCLHHRHRPGPRRPGPASTFHRGATRFRLATAVTIRAHLRLDDCCDACAARRRSTSICPITSGPTSDCRRVPSPTPLGDPDLRVAGASAAAATRHHCPITSGAISGCQPSRSAIRRGTRSAEID